MPINVCTVEQFYDRNIFRSQMHSTVFYRNKFRFRFVCPHIDCFLFDEKIMFNRNTPFEKWFDRNACDRKKIFDRNLLRLKRFSFEHVFDGNLFDRNTARLTHFSIESFFDRRREKKTKIIQEVLLFESTSILTSIDAEPKSNRRLNWIEIRNGFE